MELLKDATHQPGRWVLAPRKGSRFVGPRERARLRARERRRRIVVVMLEAAGLSALMGIFPPLRGMLFLTALILFLLLAYLGLIALMVSRGELVASNVSGGPSRPVVLVPPLADGSILASEQDRLARVVSR